MEAARTKEAASEENRTTPIVILEEPESFLHPRAQADFGRMLSTISEEVGIQIIATTHSPYMLNHKRPEFNVLFRRRVEKKKLLETEVVDTSMENWMAPFAEILGIIPDEFSAWRDIIGSTSTCAILVEGDVDKAYFAYFKEKHPEIYQIADSVEIESYGGIDALKNIAMLRFVRRKFKKMFVTFDLDGVEGVTRQLGAIGMKIKEDFCPVGKDEAGAQCIEGLLPSRIKAQVYAANVSLVEALQSAKQDERKSAKNRLKSHLLEAIQKSELQSDELIEFKKLFGIIAKALK